MMTAGRSALSRAFDLAADGCLWGLMVLMIVGNFLPIVLAVVAIWDRQFVVGSLLIVVQVVIWMATVWVARNGR